MATTTRIDFHRVNVAKEGPIQWGYLVRFFCDGWTFGTAAYRVENDPPIKQPDGSASPFDLETVGQVGGCRLDRAPLETGAGLARPRYPDPHPGADPRMRRPPVPAPVADAAPP